MDKPEMLSYDEVMEFTLAVVKDLDERRRKAVIAEYEHWKPSDDISICQSNKCLIRCGECLECGLRVRNW